MVHKYPYRAAYYRVILAWLLLLLIFLIAVIPVTYSYQQFRKAEAQTKITEAFAIAGAYDQFTLYDQRQFLKYQYEGFLLAAGLQGTVALIGLIIALPKLTSFRRFKWKYLKEIEILKAHELYRCVFDLAKSLQVDTGRITIWLDNSQETVPSCTTRWGQVHLICPLGFLNLFTSDRQSAKAMVAHELGHVVQRDTSLWRVVGVARYSILFFTGETVLLIAFFILGTVFRPASRAAVSSVDDWILTVLAYAFLIAIQIGACKLITFSKRESELGADLLASTAVTPLAVIGAVSKYLSHNQSRERFFRSYPTLKERIDNIETYFAQQALAVDDGEGGVAQRNYFSRSIRQLFLICYRPSQFENEVAGEKPGQPKLKKSESVIYIFEMLPWIILVAMLNNTIVGTLWDFVGGQYNWSWSWMGIAIGLGGGLFLMLMFTGGDELVLTIPFVISYGSFLGVLFNCMGLFSLNGAGSAAFISAGFGVLFGSGVGLAGDADRDRDRSDEGWVQSVFMGVGIGVMIGTLTGIPTAALAFLAFIFDWDFRALFNAFWPSFVAGGISGAATFYLVHFRLLYYPIELLISLFASLKSNGSKQSIIEAWHIHPISWNEVSRLPLPFSKSLLLKLANFDREAGLRQVNMVTERQFHRRTARRVLETITLDDLPAKTIEEIANIRNKLLWASQIPSQTNQDLHRFPAAIRTGVSANGTIPGTSRSE